jgi:hypothetical protein
VAGSLADAHNVRRHDTGVKTVHHPLVGDVTFTYESPMPITRNSLDTQAGPSDWFTGDVYVDAVAAPSEGSRLAASSVTSLPAPAPPGTPTPTARRSSCSKASASASAAPVRSS